MPERLVERRRSGFTLVEVGIVLVLSTVVVLGVFGTMQGTRQARENARERDLAREAARAKMEGILDEFSTNFAGLSALNNTTFPVPDPSDFPSGVVAGNDKALVLRSPTGGPAGLIIVQSSPAPLNANLVKLTVQITWRGTGAQARVNGTGASETNTLSLVTYVADRE